MKQVYTLFIFLLYFSASLMGQELQARFVLDVSKIESVDRQATQQIEEAIKRMLNEQSWTSASFERNEMIDCTVGITLNTMPVANTYGAEIHITARRPIYNSNYDSPLINYRDAKFDFSFMMGQTLDYNEVNITNNLVAVVAFYINIILGLDFDSFALGGGQPYFTKAMAIANMAQGLGSKGWEPFDGKSRYDLALSLTDENAKNFHNLWYNYHRLGLDEMAGNEARGRIRILETLKDLEALNTSRPNSVLITLFGETKLDEFVKICGKATAEEKKDAKERLKKLFPGKRTIIDAMK